MSDRDACRECATLRAENAKLRGEIKQLKALIARIRHYVLKAANVTGPLATRLGIFLATTKMRMDKGNMPRAEWAYLKGARKIAKLVYKKLLEVNYYLKEALGY